MTSRAHVLQLLVIAVNGHKQPMCRLRSVVLLDLASRPASPCERALELPPARSHHTWTPKPGRLDGWHAPKYLCQHLALVEAQKSRGTRHVGEVTREVRNHHSTPVTLVPHSARPPALLMPGSRSPVAIKCSTNTNKHSHTSHKRSHRKSKQTLVTEHHPRHAFAALRVNLQHPTCTPHREP